MGLKIFLAMPLDFITKNHSGRFPFKTHLLAFEPLKLDQGARRGNDLRFLAEEHSSIHFHYLSLHRTQGLSVSNEEVQEDFPVELSLHPDPVTLEALPCTPANAVEVHRDFQPGEKRKSTSRDA